MKNFPDRENMCKCPGLIGSIAHRNAVGTECLRQSMVLTTGHGRYTDWVTKDLEGHIYYSGLSCMGVTKDF